MFAALGIVARVPAHPLAGPLDAEGGGGPARPRHRLVGGGTDRGARVRPLLDHRPALLLFVAIGLVAVLFDATSPGLTGMRLSGFLVMFGLALLVAWSGGVAVIAMSAPGAGAATPPCCAPPGPGKEHIRPCPRGVIYALTAVLTLVTTRLAVIVASRARRWQSIGQALRAWD